MSAKAEETLGVLNPVLGALNLVFGCREWSENLHEGAHGLIEAVNRFGQRADRSRECLDHFDVVLDRLGRSIYRSDRVKRFVLGLL